MIQAVLKGSDAAAVIGGVANTIYSLIAKPGIQTIAELRGKVVALSAPPDTITLSMRMLLAKGGLKDDDYRTKQIIGSTQRGECLASGACDAVPLGQPDDIVFQQKGFRKLGDSLEVMPNLQFNVIAVRRSWAAAHKDTVAALARAYGDDVSISARSGQSRRCHQDCRRDYWRKRAGRACGACALLRSRPRRDAETGRDQHGGRQTR